MPTYEPTWDSLRQYRLPHWFCDAKFGIFIHWGIYSVPAVFDEWYPRRMYQKDTAIYQYHRETYGENFGYKDFIPQLGAEKFDPAEWAALFREAGARYIVPVAEHHDGFPIMPPRSPAGMPGTWAPSATSLLNWARQYAPRG